jgi:hypothetical protein
MNLNERQSMKPFDFERSPEDQATVARWRRRVLVFYGSVGLALIAVVTAARIAHVATLFASR